ncbi:hypothetical protein [Marinicella gelatinilytica]|uniref:hypothetical protein n=1 Tax=Marinicella gelatinilytica TaxID=2996017 RepID=UPI002260E81F|nr:hypothetical protein [Marinicella gelatinilytica]MCX7543847.1 hypothetical protein [Marinicella gelatinilytica]
MSKDAGYRPAPVRKFLYAIFSKQYSEKSMVHDSKKTLAGAGRHPVSLGMVFNGVI